MKQADPGSGHPSDDGSSEECENPPECRRARDAQAALEGRAPDSTPPAPSSSSASGPTTEFLAEGVRRLKLMGIVLSSTLGFLLVLNIVLFDVLGPPMWTTPPHNDLNRAKYVVIIVASLALVAASRANLPPCGKLNIGLGYQVLVALLIAIHTSADAQTLTRFDMAHISWLCVWITLFPLVVPLPPRRVLAACFVSAAMGPLAFGFWVVKDGLAIPPFQAMFEAFLPSFVCAAMAGVPAWVMNNIGMSMAKQSKELRKLGSYQLVRRLGKGGMGEVWRAEHSMLARPAAVKLIKKELLGQQDPVEQKTALMRFEREARATAALRSPHTVSLYDFGITDDGAFYYVMELLQGLDLETLVERHGPVPPARAVHLLRQACMSLAEAHATGLVHRDVKPANIYSCRLGLEHDFVKVLDFGLVASVDRQQKKDVKLTGDGFIVGTPAFMAPEMVRGNDMDGRADLYALGCVGFWLLTGRYVFEGDSPMNVLIDHAKTPAPAPSSRAPGIPASIDRVILACLAKDPKDRPQTAQELMRMLDDALVEAKQPPWTNEQARGWWDSHRPPVIDEKELTETVQPRTPSRMPTVITPADELAAVETASAQPVA